MWCMLPCGHRPDGGDGCALKNDGNKEGEGPDCDEDNGAIDNTIEDGMDKDSAVVNQEAELCTRG